MRSMERKSGHGKEMTRKPTHTPDLKDLRPPAHKSPTHAPSPDLRPPAMRRILRPHGDDKIQNHRTPTQRQMPTPSGVSTDTAKKKKKNEMFTRVRYIEYHGYTYDNITWLYAVRGNNKQKNEMFTKMR